MPLFVGEKLGHYEILSLLGKGGMGEVYRGRDTKLKRDVAIKVLPEGFARDAERMARFQREAEVLASLNHSNIAAIYGVEDHALVMELVEGDSPKGPLGFDDAWKIASQMGAALEYAHDKGIVHRDLKPANIKITPEGVVKLLDFGLAKAFTNRGEARTASESPENSPTLTIGATEVGVILGTAAYMPPEQAKGKAVDKRADIWSFGVVLYELMTGERLFKGEEVSDTLAQVLTKEPDLAKVPSKARRLLSRCLEKDPKKRLRDIGEAAYLLDEAPVTGPSAPRHRSWLPWCIAAFLLLALMPANILHFREQPPQTPSSVRFQFDVPERFTGTFHLSPDGRYLAMVAQRKLWIRPLGSLEAKAVNGVEDPAYPFWSPDSASVGFFAQGKLKKVALDGGVVQTLCEAPEGRGAAWNPDGIIVFGGGNGGLKRVSAAGGTVTSATKLPGISSGLGGDAHRYPVFLPDGRHFLFVYLTGNAETAGIYAGSLDGGEPVRIAADVSNPGYAPGPAPNGGYLLFVRERTLMAQPFDAGRLRITGEMFPLVQQVLSAGNTANFAFSVSANGAMSYRVGEQRRNWELSWFDRTGKRLDAASKAFQLFAFTLAPDQTRLAVSLLDVEKGVLRNDIWRLETIRSTPSRFTYGPAPGWGIPVWSPDGNQLAYATANFAGVGSYEIRRKRWNMTGKEELLLRNNSLVYPRDWSPDGKWLLYSVNGDLWLLPLEGDHKPIPFTQTPASNEDLGQFSPDSKWIAYVSNESGRDQVYVQPIPATTAKWQLSIAGGTYPRWRSDGKELFFIASDGKLMAVPIVSAGIHNVASAGAFEPGAPQVLFDIGDADGFGNGFCWPYQPAAGGQRFLIGLPPGGEKPPPITMVLNWQSGLKK